MIIYLTAPCGAGSRSRGMRLLPGGIRPLSGVCGQAGHCSCSVLHRMGFVVPPSLRSERWALTPPFHPYRDVRSRSDRIDSATGHRGGIFSVALSLNHSEERPDGRYPWPCPVEAGLSSAKPRQQSVGCRSGGLPRPPSTPRNTKFYFNLATVAIICEPAYYLIVFSCHARLAYCQACKLNWSKTVRAKYLDYIILRESQSCFRSPNHSLLQLSRFP